MLDSMPLDDPGQIHQDARARLLRGQRWAVASVVLTMLVMALVEFRFPPPGRSGEWVAAALAVAALAMWWTLRRPGHRWEGGLLVLAVLFAGVLSAVHLGTVRSISTLAFLAAVVVAGTYLSLRAMLLTTVAGLVLLAGLTGAEAHGLLPGAVMAVDLRFWAMGSGLLAVTALVLMHARHVTEVAYLRRLGQMEDRLRLERERDQSLQRARRLFQINPTALVIQRAGSQAVQEVNPAFERLLGYPAAALTGQAMAGLWLDGAAWAEHGQRLMERGRTGWEVAQWRHADGQPRRLAVSSEWLDDKAGALVLTTVMPTAGDGDSPPA
jgi:PAS domain S-box-containing protein